jgi:hypothetical protein
MLSVHGLRSVPSWACLFSRLAGYKLRRLHTFVEYPIHSHLLGASPLSASRLSPFRPCTPTFDNQSPAVGRCFLSSTWRVGVGKIDFSLPHLHGHTVVKVSPSCSSSLTLFTSVGFEQTDRTTATCTTSCRTHRGRTASYPTVPAQIPACGLL